MEIQIVQRVWIVTNSSLAGKKPPLIIQNLDSFFKSLSIRSIKNFFVVA